MTKSIVRTDYPRGTVEAAIRHGSKTIDVFCGTMRGQKRCGYIANLKIEDLPRVSWREIGRRLRCPKCGVKGDVQIRFRHEGCAARPANIIGGQFVPQ